MNTDIIELRDKTQDNSWAQVEGSGLLEVITHYQLALVLDAVHSLGMAQKLYQSNPGSENDILSGLDPILGHELLHYLEIHGLIHCADHRVTVTPKGRGMLSEVGGAQLGFYVESYGGVIKQIGDLLRRRLAYGDGVERDGRALGVHCATIFHEYHTPTILRAIEDVDATCILDLGCGGGQLLVDACVAKPNLRGIGLDISVTAIEYARDLAKTMGVDGRVTFHVGDAFRPDLWPTSCAEADVLCAVGVLHEHFRDGEQAVINIINIYARLFERHLRAFILGEPEIRYDLEKNDVDLYLVHIFTAQGFPRYREKWLELFPRTDLHCTSVYTRPGAGPRFNFFRLVPRSRASHR